MFLKHSKRGNSIWDYTQILWLEQFWWKPFSFLYLVYSYVISWLVNLRNDMVIYLLRWWVHYWSFKIAILSMHFQMYITIISFCFVLPLFSLFSIVTTFLFSNVGTMEQLKMMWMMDRILKETFLSQRQFRYSIIVNCF